MPSDQQITSLSNPMPKLPHDFSADWLLDSKIKELTDFYFRQLPNEDRKRLEKAYTGLSSKEEYVKFLRTDGALIWTLFVRDLSSGILRRDFTPLSEGEFSELSDGIASAFKSRPEPAVRTFARPVRLVVGLLLLVGGLSIILLTYQSIPGIAVAFRKSTEDAVNKELQSSLANVQRELEKRTFDKLAEQGTRIERQFAQISDLLSSVTAISHGVEAIRAQQNSAVGQLGDAKTFNELIKTVQDAAKSFSSPQAAAGQAADKPPSIPSVAASLHTLVSSINGWLEDDDLKVRFSKAKQWLDNSPVQAVKEFQASFADFQKDYWWPDWATLKDNPKRLAAFKQLMAWKRSEETKQGIESPDEFVLAVCKSNKILKVPDGLSSSVLKLAESTKALEDSAARLTDEVKRQSDLATAVKAALDQTNQEGALGRIERQASNLISSVDVATTAVRGSLSTYESAQQALKRLKESTESLQKISALQEDLAYKGASPAVILLLAIGGMFTTFGLSSLLSWVKQTEKVHSDHQWSDRTKQFTELSASLLRQGIDPVPVISRLSAAFPTDESDTKGFATPLLETAHELLRLLKTRFHG